jgi:hypothetical protein
VPGRSPRAQTAEPAGIRGNGYEEAVAMFVSFGGHVREARPFPVPFPIPNGDNSLGYLHSGHASIDSLAAPMLCRGISRP